MSSQNQETCETTPLLLASQPASRSSWILSRGWLRLSPEALLIPVVLATKLGGLIPATTFVELVRQAVCKFSDISRGDPVSIAAGGPSPAELCDAPEIVRSFSTVVAILAAADGIISMAGCGILSRISSHYGRKPAFLCVLAAGIMGSCLIPGSQYMPNWLAGWVFLAGMLCQLFSGQLPYAYLAHMYIVDVCAPEDRTAALSKIGGWGALGASIPLALGGSITTKTGNPLIVYYIAAAMFISAFIYVGFALPESFPEEKRNALSRMRQQPSTHHIITRLASFFRVFEPLKLLVPVRTTSGTRNWRLTWCALHMLVFVTAGSYASSAWLVLATSKYHFTPADTGLFLTIVTVSGAITLAVIVPLLVRLLRPYYYRKITRSPLTDEGLEEPELETSDHLDVHLAFMSCVIAAISFLCAAASKTVLALIVSGIFIGFSFVHAPPLRSLVAGSVDPLKQGEALAAIEMVNGAGAVLSPIIMGSVLTATIDTMPLFFFYVYFVAGLVSAAMLLLVRDADRYQGSNDM